MGAAGSRPTLKYITLGQAVMFIVQPLPGVLSVNCHVVTASPLAASLHTEKGPLQEPEMTSSKTSPLAT